MCIRPCICNASRSKGGGDDTGRKNTDIWSAMRDGETTKVPLEEVAGKIKDGRSEMQIDQRSENDRYQFWR